MRLVFGVYDSLPWIGVSTMLVALVFVPRGKRLFSLYFPSGHGTAMHRVSCCFVELYCSMIQFSELKLNFLFGN